VHVPGEGSTRERVARFCNNMGNGEHDLVVIEVQCWRLDNRVNLNEKLSLHSLPGFIC